MYVLIARDPNGRVVGSIKLESRPQTIGRGHGCALVLPSTGVSRVHASVYLHGDGVVIADAGSANGVKVDGELIKGPTLVDHTNDILLSNYSLEIRVDGATEALPRATTDIRNELVENELVEELDDTRLEPHAGAAAALARSKMELVGRGGPYDGARIAIDKPLMIVGRVKSNDIVIEDPSISRRHAQLRLSVTNDKMTVLDLRSHNGTYVQGARIKRVDIEPGAIVRFGDIAFKLEWQSAEQSASSRRRMSPMRRLVIGVAAVLLLLGGVAFIAYLRRPPPPVVKHVTPEDRLRKLQAETQTIIDKARRHLVQREWSAAIVQLDKALAKDPLNTASKRLRNKALAELTNENVYDEGGKYLALGNRENLLKAKDIYSRIPKSSVYHREVRYKIKAIDERVAETFRIEGVSRCRSRYWVQCQQLLCKFFTLMPVEKAVPGERGLRRLLRRAERRIGRRRDFSPCKAKRFLNEPGTVAGAPKEDPEELLSEKYELVELRAIIRLYIGGKIDIALKELSKLRNKRNMRPHLAELGEVNRQLLIIRGKYQ